MATGLTTGAARAAGASTDGAPSQGPEVPTGAPVGTPHPDYAGRETEWRTMRDCVRGATAVADATETYLPMPSGFLAQADRGVAMYQAYVLRAQFPEIVAPTVFGMSGVVHRTEAQVELPPELEYLYEDADGEGTTLEALHRRITDETLTTGRVALLADAPREGGEPRIKLYVAECLVNWSERRDFYVLRESELERDGFSWELRDRWRVLALDEESRYGQQLWERDRPRGEVVLPVVLGGATMDEIPLTIVGARTLRVAPDDPPLLGVARSALAIYRLDADYRHQLFMSGQETLVTIGLRPEDAPRVVGAGVVVALPQGADAKYVGPSGSGIAAHKTAIEDERANAAALGARIFDSPSQGAVESGEALRIRVAATTATLLSIAMSSAQGLEASLRWCGRMRGVSEEVLSAVVVRPNLSFLDSPLSPQEAMQLVTMWQSGAISYQTLYENLQRGEIASSERTADEEQQLVEAEAPADAGGGGFAEEDAGGGGDEPPDYTDEELAETFGPELMGDLS